MQSRLDNFVGPSSQYVSYLEQIVLDLRQRHRRCQCHVVRQEVPPGGSPDSPPAHPQELEIVHFQPPTGRPEHYSHKRPRSATALPRWKEQALTLIRETPKAEMWTEKLKERGIYNTMSSGLAVERLLLLSVDESIREANTVGSSMVHVLHSTPLARISHYARVSVQREIDAAVATALANYQKFLVLSSCAVLVDIGTPAKEVYDVVRICIGKLVTDEHCRRTLRSCLFVHELLDNLYMAGWGLRAFELLLIWNKTPTFYCTISHAYDAGLRFLKTELCKPELTANVNTQSTLWTSIFAPKIIHDILGERVQVVQVAEALRYKHAAVTEGLLQRSMSVACLPSWASEEAVNKLATLLYVLGTSRVPMELFTRARNPYLIWGEDGEPKPERVDIVDVVRIADTFQAGLRRLELENAIRVERSARDEYLVIVDRDVLLRLAYSVDETWAMEAVKVVFSAFPVDRRLLPGRSFSTETSMLPQLRHVLQYLPEINVSDALPPAHIVEVCLSASNYRPLADKESLVAAAESLTERYALGDVTMHRVRLRRLVLSRISSCEWSWEARRFDFPRSDPRSNGYYGEYLLIFSESLFRSQGPELALSELDTYEPWVAGHPSTLESARLYEVGVLRGKILHFSGRFGEAKRTLERVVGNNHQDTTSPSKATAHLAAVCCELGEADLGIRYASAHLEDVLKIQSAESGSARRLKLALAYALLLKTMWVVLAKPEYDVRLVYNGGDLDRAQQLFQDLIRQSTASQTWPALVNRVSILLGLAAAAHLAGSLRDALTHYESALASAEQCGWKAGYIESIIYLSRSVALYRLGETEEANECAATAKTLYSSHAYFFVGFGTCWPEILRIWLVAQGRQSVIPQRSWERT